MTTWVDLRKHAISDSLPMMGILTGQKPRVDHHQRKHAQHPVPRHRAPMMTTNPDMITESNHWSV